MLIKGNENCNQYQAKCPFAAGMVLKSMEDHGFKIITTATKQIYKNSKTFLIGLSIVNNPKKGCDIIKIYDNCDTTRFENCFDQTKYSVSCININDCKLKSSNKEILLLKYANKHANNPKIYVFNETDAFQHIIYYNYEIIYLTLFSVEGPNMFCIQKKIVV
jgi:hypothetical protein